MAAQMAGSDLKDFEREALLTLKALVRKYIESPKRAAEAVAQRPAATADSADDAPDAAPAAAADATPAAVDADSADDAAAAAAAAAAANEISIWGVPLLKDEEKTRTILLKFLRAKNFKPEKSMELLKKTLRWRQTIAIDDLLKEDLRLPKMGEFLFMAGADRDGHPVCYNVYGKQWVKVFYDWEGRKKLKKWRIQFLERSIRDLINFSDAGVHKFLMVYDFDNDDYFASDKLRRPVSGLEEYYPDFIAKEILINVPWRYRTISSVFMTDTTKSKCVLAAPHNSGETLFKTIKAEQVPVQFGGMKEKVESEFTFADPVVEDDIMPKCMKTIEIQVAEKCTFSLELRVLDWDISLEILFMSDAHRPSVIKASEKMTTEDDGDIARNKFDITESGKVVIRIDNGSSKKKKKILYRYKQLQV